jgi:hypothetical protein
VAKVTDIHKAAAEVAQSVLDATVRNLDARIVKVEEMLRSLRERRAEAARKAGWRV